MKNFIQREPIFIDKQLNLLPYTKGYEVDFLQLVKANKDRLINSFPNLLQKLIEQNNVNLYFEEKIKKWNQNSEFAYLIFYQNVLIGHFNIKDVDFKKSCAELSYFIDKDFEGRGIVSSIIENRKDFIFNTLNLKTIKARCAIDNKASEKVMLKVGMHYEGTIYQNYIAYDDKIIDTYIYALEKK